METTSFFAGGFFYNPNTRAVLLHLRDGNTIVNPNKWGFFGGTSEPGETPIDTFVREIHEELNIQLAKEQIRALRDYHNEKRNTHRYVFYVESDMEKNAMTLGEGADFDWIPLQDVFTYDLTSRTEEDLRYFLQASRL